jgi:hypothetical protein
MNREKSRTSKTHRHWRGLAFEQMESRLALSATGIETTGIQFQWNDSSASLAAYQGGFVELDVQPLANQVRYHVASSVLSSVPRNNDIELNLRDWIQFEGTLGAYDSGSFTTIPQPGMGPMRPDGGTIAIGEIFAIAPLVKMGNSPEEVAKVVRGQFESSEVNATSSEESLSFSRARDVYFEVAAHVEDNELEKPTRAIRTEATVASAQLGADEELIQKSDSVSIAALVARGRSLPAARNTLTSEPVQIRNVAKPLREAPSMTQSPESESKPEEAAQANQVSQTEVREQVFQVWRDSKLDAMKRTPGRPEEEEQDDSASWPVLAALAVGGLVFSSRRLTSPAPSQQQPPTRKPLGFSRRNS